jgi:hypothetical protein
MESRDRTHSTLQNPEICQANYRELGLNLVGAYLAYRQTRSIVNAESPNMKGEVDSNIESYDRSFRDSRE